MSLIIDEIDYALEEQEVCEKDKSTSQNEECDIKWIHKKCTNCNSFFTQERKQGMRSSRCIDCKNNRIKETMPILEKRCNVCKKTFKIFPHMKKIVKGKIIWRIRCENCKSIQRAPKGPLPRLNRHYFECDICGLGFKNRSMIYMHMDNHLQSDELICRVCKKKSKNRGVLRTHLKTHFETLICHLCGFTTTTQHSLKLHMEAHEADPTVVKDCSNIEPRSRFDKKPVEGAEFPCKYCGFILKSKSSQHSHERRHESNAILTDFKCKVCGEIFQCANDLRTHNMTHSNRPLLFCTFPGCSQFFNRIKPLNAHIRNVHKEKNIFCEICNKKFKMRGSLVKHLKNNRCIPVAVRKVHSGKATLVRSSKLSNKSFDQLTEEARIAKEQFREMGGLLSNENASGDEGKEFLVKKKRKSDSKRDFDFIDDQNSEDDSDDSTTSSLDDKISIKMEPVEVEIDASPIKSSHDMLETHPMVKIEIKMEPDDEIETEGCVALPQHEFFDLGNHFDNLNPAVLLQRLDHDNKESTKKKKVTTERVRRIPRIKRFKSLNRSCFVPGMSFVCDFCGVSFEKKTRLREHLQEHKDLTRSRHRCTRCGEEFEMRNSLKKHLRDAHDINFNETFRNTTDPFICDMCGKHFVNYTAISAHLRITHKKIADFHCHICPAKFKTRMYVERHIEDVHEKIFRFVCKVCGKFFRRKHQVKEHEQLHNDPTPCTVCGKLVKNLRTHIKQVHETAPKRKSEFQCCVECGQMVSIYNMQHHIDRIHRKLPIPGKIYPCVHCAVTFVRMNDLRRHKYTTHLEKPFKECPYEGCGSIFPKTKALNVHIRNVHRDNNVPCPICNKIFQSDSGIRKHMAKKHKMGYRKSSEIVGLAEEQVLEEEIVTENILMQ